MKQPLWHQKRVVVCVGTGGVGKTTVAASLAMAAAGAGRRVLVMTIDPSRRLSQALGLHAQDSTMQPVDLKALTAQGHPPASGGSLHALILDVQKTFDSLIRDRARTPEDAERILRNRIYHHFSASLAGSHEYAAVEKLWDCYNDPHFDLIVLDTPPSQHAIDFLDAPGRITRFLQGQDGTEEQAPSLAKKMSRKLFDLGGSLVTRTVGKVSGAQALAEVTSFLNSLKDMYASFNERALGVSALLRSDEVAFALVGGPSPAQLDALHHFARELEKFDITPTGWVLNRVHPAPMPQEAVPTLQAALGKLQLSDAPWWPALERACMQELALAARDAAQVQALGAKHPHGSIYTISEMNQGADSVDRLAKLAQTFHP
jgi:anion-transporting  ArsA/GET3 family ATPase